MSQQQPRARATLTRAATLFEGGRFDEAAREYERAVAEQPSDPAAHVGLAKLRYMQGDGAFARDFVAAVRADRESALLQVQLANVLRQIGDLASAEVLLRDLLARVGPMPELRASLAAVLHGAGRLLEAYAEARAAVSERPDDADIARNLVAVLLSLGRADEAMPLIREQRSRSPLHCGWLANEATAARLLGDSTYEVLCDYERFVRTYDLPTPRGWASTAAFNEDLAANLSRRHTLVREPFDQTLRFGTQTMGNLVNDRDLIVQAALTAFAEPIADYRARLGQAIDHPLSARNHGEARFTGCWSVRLGHNGFHVNHIHPHGWLSSAYYVSVSKETADAARQSGWIKFGEPDLPVPGAEPALTIQPRAGRLVLFPSYLWHGTTPLQDSGPRLTMAFDVVPTPLSAR